MRRKSDSKPRSFRRQNSTEAISFHMIQLERINNTNNTSKSSTNDNNRNVFDVDGDELSSSGSSSGGDDHPMHLTVPGEKSQTNTNNTHDVSSDENDDDGDNDKDDANSPASSQKVIASSRNNNKGSVTLDIPSLTATTNNLPVDDEGGVVVTSPTHQVPHNVTAVTSSTQEPPHFVFALLNMPPPTTSNTTSTGAHASTTNNINTSEADAVAEALVYMNLNPSLSTMAPQNIILEAAAAHYLLQQRQQQQPLARQASFSSTLTRRRSSHSINTNGGGGGSTTTTQVITGASSTNAGKANSTASGDHHQNHHHLAPIVPTFTSGQYRSAAEQTRFRRSLKFMMDLSRRTERTRQRDDRISERERQKALASETELELEETYRKLVVWNSFIAAYSFQKLFQKTADMIEGNKVIDQLLSPLLRRFIYRYRAKKKLLYCLAMVLVVPSGGATTNNNILMPATTITSDTFLYSITMDAAALPGATIDIRSFVAERERRNSDHNVHKGNTTTSPATPPITKTTTTTSTTSAKKQLKASLPKVPARSTPSTYTPEGGGCGKSSSSRRSPHSAVSLTALLQIIHQWAPVSTIPLPAFKNAFESSAPPPKNSSSTPQQQHGGGGGSGQQHPRFMAGVQLSVKDTKPPGVLAIQNPTAPSDTSIVVQPQPGSSAAFAAAASGTAAQPSVVHNPSDVQIFYGNSIPAAFHSSTSVVKSGKLNAPSSTAPSFSLPDIRQPRRPVTDSTIDSPSTSSSSNNNKALSRQPISMPSAPLFAKWSASHVSGLLSLAKPRYYHAGQYIFYADKSAYNSGVPEPQRPPPQETATTVSSRSAKSTAGGGGVQFSEPSAVTSSDHYPTPRSTGRNATLVPPSALELDDSLMDIPHPGSHTFKRSNSMHTTLSKRGQSFLKLQKDASLASMTAGGGDKFTTNLDDTTTSLQQQQQPTLQVSSHYQQSAMSTLIDLREREQRSSSIIPAHKAGGWCDPAATIRNQNASSGNSNTNARRGSRKQSTGGGGDSSEDDDDDDLSGIFNTSAQSTSGALGFSQFRATTKSTSKKDFCNNKDGSPTTTSSSQNNFNSEVKQYLRQQLGYDGKTSLGALSSEFAGRKHGSCNLHAIVIVACGTICEFSPLSSKQRSYLQEMRRRERRLRKGLEPNDESSKTPSSGGKLDEPIELGYFTRGDVIGAPQAVLDCPFYKNVRCETDCVVYEIPVLEFLRYVYGTTSTVAASELLGSAFGEPLAPIPKAPKPPTTTQMTGNMKVISARVKTLVSSPAAGGVPPMVISSSTTTAPTTITTQARRDMITAARAVAKKIIMNHKETPAYYASTPSFLHAPSKGGTSVGSSLFRNSHPIFTSWPSDALSLLLDHSTRVATRPGEIMIRDLYSTTHMWLVTVGDCVMTTTPQALIKDITSRLLQPNCHASPSSNNTKNNATNTKDGAVDATTTANNEGICLKRAVNGKMYGVETVIPWDVQYMKNKPYLVGSAWSRAQKKPRKSSLHQTANSTAPTTTTTTTAAAAAATTTASKMKVEIIDPMTNSDNVAPTKSIIKVNSNASMTTSLRQKGKPAVVLDVPTTNHGGGGHNNQQYGSSTNLVTIASLMRRTDPTTTTSNNNYSSAHQNQDNHHTNYFGKNPSQQYVSPHNLNDDTLLSSGNKPVAMVSATYCEAYCISRADFMSVLKTFFVPTSTFHNYSSTGLVEIDTFAAFGGAGGEYGQSSPANHQQQSLLAHMTNIATHQLVNYPGREGMAVGGRLAVTPESLKASVRCFNLLPPSVLSQISKHMSIQVVLPGEYLLRSYATSARSQQLHFTPPTNLTQLLAANAKIEAAKEAADPATAAAANNRGGVQSLCTDAYVLLFGALMRIPLLTSSPSTTASSSKASEISDQFEELFPLSFHCFEECLTNHSVPYELYAPHACVVAKISKEFILESVIADHQRRRQQRKMAAYRVDSNGGAKSTKKRRDRSNSQLGMDMSDGEMSVMSRSRRTSVDSSMYGGDESDMNDSGRTSRAGSDDEELGGRRSRSNSILAASISSAKQRKTASEEAPLVYQIIQKAETVVEERYGDAFRKRGDGSPSAATAFMPLTTTKYLRGDDDITGLTKKEIRAKLEPATVKELNVLNHLTEKGSAPETNEQFMSRVRCAERALQYRKEHGENDGSSPNEITHVIGPDGRKIGISTGKSHTLEARIREEHFHNVQVELHKLGVENKVLVSLSAQLASATAFAAQESGGGAASGFTDANLDEGRDAAKLEWLRRSPQAQDETGMVLRGPLMYAEDDGEDLEFASPLRPGDRELVDRPTTANSAMLAITSSLSPLPSLTIPPSSTAFITHIDSTTNNNIAPLSKSKATKDTTEDVDWSVLRPLSNVSERQAAKNSGVTSPTNGQAPTTTLRPKIPEVPKLLSLSNAARGGDDDANTAWGRLKKQYQQGNGGSSNNNTGVVISTDVDQHSNNVVSPPLLCTTTITTSKAVADINTAEGLDAMILHLSKKKVTNTDRDKDARLLQSISPRYHAPTFQATELQRIFDQKLVESMRAGNSSSKFSAATIGAISGGGTPRHISVAPNTTRIRDISRKMDAFSASADRVSVMMTGRLAEDEKNIKRREVVASSARLSREIARSPRTLQSLPTHHHSQHQPETTAAPQHPTSSSANTIGGTVNLTLQATPQSTLFSAPKSQQVATLKKREALQKRLYN